jgi:acyl carrier protein
MQPVKDKPSEYFTLVQRIIADTSGIDVEDIHDDDELLFDLNIDMMYEFPVIIRRIEAEISNPDEDVVHKLPLDRVRKCNDVMDLVELVEEVAEE